MPPKQQQTQRRKPNPQPKRARPQNATNSRAKRAPRRQAVGPMVPGPRGLGTQAHSAAPAIVRMRNTEYWATKTAAATAAVSRLLFTPGTTGMRSLDGLAKTFDNYKLHSATVTVEGLGPTTSSTLLTACIDYDPKDDLTTVQAILNRVPNISVPAYRRGHLRTYRLSIQRRNLMLANGAQTSTADDEVAFTIFTHVSASTTSDTYRIYCTYDIEFLNPSQH